MDTTKSTIPENPGAVRDRFDSRDFQFIAGAAPFDWQKGFNIEEKIGVMPVKNQGQSYSCGGQAWAYYGQAIEAIATGSFEERSAKFIYAQTFVPGGGSAGRENCNIAIKQGWARESVLPSYENGGVPSEAFITRSQDITAEVRKDANKAAALSYANVPANIDTFAQAIQQNNGIILGIEGSNNGTWLSEFPKPGDREWAHWLYAGKAKLIDGKKYIGVLNSWGEACGNKGWQWIGEDYFNGRVWYAWTLQFLGELKHKFLIDLKLGDKGQEVSWLQNRLQAEGFLLQGELPAVYGPKTRKAVYDYQISKGISPMTIHWYKGKYCGKLTRQTLNQMS